MSTLPENVKVTITASDVMRSTERRAVPGYMARPADSWLDETVTVRRVLGNAVFWLLCIGLPVVLALAVGPR